MKSKELHLLGIRGKVGNLVYKRYKKGTVVTRYPDMSQAGCSASQRMQRNRFQQAVELAKAALADPKQKQYFKKSAGKGSAWNKALSAFLKKLRSDEKR